jgi:hypothetical protein
MTPHDQQRLGALISEFISGCEFTPPFYLVAVGANGAVAVTRHGIPDEPVRQVCGHNVDHMVAPIVITVIAMDGRAKSAKIEIIEATKVMQ